MSPESFIERIHRALHGTDPRPLVREVRPDGVEELPRHALATLVSHVRGGLAQRGVQSGDRVAHIGPNRAAWVAVDLATLFEGAIAVPLYARQAPDELVAMLRDCDPRVIVVADEALRDALRDRWPSAPIATWDELIAAPSKVTAPVRRAPDDVVTLVYTSGTSGDAKGAAITLGNVDFMLPAVSAALDGLLGDESGDDRVFHYLPFAFMGSRIVLWTCLWRETGVYLSTDLDRLTAELPAAAPHWLLNVPVLLERIKRGVEQAIAERGFVARLLYRRALAAWDRHLRGETLGSLDRFVLDQAEKRIFSGVRARFGPNLRFLVCGSAALAPETQRWFEMVGLPVYQVYGLTETTAIVTMDRAEQAVPGKVGFTIPGVEARITEEGELQVRGPNIFAGYWNRPDATAAAFEDGWFRTGDQVEIDEEGRLAIVGRLKHVLVPESGHNVAPEPIEEALRARIPGAEQVVVVGHARPHLAALVTGDVRDHDVATAIEALNAELPHYKRIRGYACVGPALTHEDGALTANGKLRRKVVEQRFDDRIRALYR